MTAAVADGLVIGVDGLWLPRNLVTSVTGVFGQREAGKSYTTHAIVEEVVDQVLGQVVVFDPKGDWWGIRSSADGRGPGLPFVILGGERGDLPLEPGSGSLVADLVVDHRDHLLLDLSDFASDAEEHRFMYDFAVRLWRRKARDHRIVLLVIEEAATFVPQNPMGGMEPLLLGAMHKIAKMGRQRGIGEILADQRFADVNKKSLSQAAALLVGGLTSPTDRAAFDKYLKDNATDEARKAAAGALPSLPTGHLLAWAPKWGHTSTDLRVRKLRTYDSHRTPEPGESIEEPSGRAHIDLGELAEAMAGLVREQAASDPAALRKRVTELEAELAAVREAQPRPEPEVVTVTVPDPDAVAALRAASDIVYDGIRSLAETARVIAPALAAVGETVPAPPPADPPVPPAAEAAPARDAAPEPAPRPAAARRSEPPPDDGLTPYQEELLRGLLVRSPATAAQLQVITGKSAKSSTFELAMKAFRERGYIEQGKPYRITAAGRRRCGDAEPAPSGPALLGYWRARITKPAALAFLDAVAAAGPAGLTRDALLERTGYSPTSSSTDDALKYLRDLGLLTGGRGAPYRLPDELLAAS